ncbi:hypothetical protein RJG79_04060 [Mycoplasmatota bacterium WC44]
MDEDKRYELQEALCKLVIAESRSIETMVDHLDDTEIFSKDELLLTNQQVTQLVNQLVNINN